MYASFVDWPDAATASPYYMDQTPDLAGYHCAPQLFYFTPQNKWYLVYQSGPPTYSTADDPSQPDTWTAPQYFYSSDPAIITQNGGWLDFWVICDKASCYLFFTDDRGHFYRAQTAIGDFPNGFGDPVIVMDDPNRLNLYEAGHIYTLKQTGEYLAIIEAATAQWRRFFRAFTAPALNGTWTPLADTWADPFAGQNNVTFETTEWTRDISHGEMIRDGYDETLTVDLCKMQFLYQGVDPNAPQNPYSNIPYRLGLLTSAW
jgi:hypothetical protein